MANQATMYARVFWKAFQEWFPTKLFPCVPLTKEDILFSPMWPYFNKLQTASNGGNQNPVFCLWEGLYRHLISLTPQSLYSIHIMTVASSVTFFILFDLFFWNVSPLSIAWLSSRSLCALCLACFVAFLKVPDPFVASWTTIGQPSRLPPY